MKLGIFGGTFDPYTCGHYEIVKKVLKDKLVDKVVVIPTIVDYHRTGFDKFFSNEQRLKIIKRWFSDFKDVIIDDYEYKLLDRNPETCADRRYLHMLKDIKTRYFSEERVDLVTIIGGDSWNKLDTWYEWKQLFGLSEFIVVKRDEDKLKDLQIESIACEKTVIEIDNKFANVSATKLRSRFSKANKDLALAVYLNEIDDYKKTGKFVGEFGSKIEAKVEDEMEDRLTKIFDVLEDPYKDTSCKYSLIEDIILGKI